MTRFRWGTRPAALPLDRLFAAYPGLCRFDLDERITALPLGDVGLRHSAAGETRRLQNRFTWMFSLKYRI